MSRRRRKKEAQLLELMVAFGEARRNFDYLAMDTIIDQAIALGFYEAVVEFRRQRNFIYMP